MVSRKPGVKRRTKIGGQFAPRLIEMLRSPAMSVLSLSARRVLDRIEIEMGDHGGRDKGALPVTYDDFVRFGIDRHSIAPAIRENVALGFIEITQQGRAGNAEHRTPSHYRLTYRHTNFDNPTDEWRRIETLEQAEFIAREARKPRREKQNSSGGKHPVSVGKIPTEITRLPVVKTHTTAPVGKTHTTLDISGRGTAHR